MIWPSSNKGLRRFPSELLAIFAEREDELGSLEEGKIANILILDKNPLLNIKHTSAIHGLIRRGEYLGKDKLDQLLEELKN